jgi:glutaredoxin
MARATTFAEKAAKRAAKHDIEINCPHCKKTSKVIFAKVVSSVKTEKNSFKYLEKNAKLCSNCLTEL